MKTIKVEKAFNQGIFIDTRTPKEFEEDHILEAVNVPLLSNEERHEIGMIYKQKSREKAIEKGMEVFPEKIPSIYNAVKDHRDKTIVVYCARGGMRSRIIASLLESIGFKVLQLEGGYNHFRHYILDKLNNLKKRVEKLQKKGLKPAFAVVIVGDDKPSHTYVRMKGQAARDIGLGFAKIDFPKTISKEDLILEIQKIQNKKVSQ